MRSRLTTGWSFMRVLRLLMGIASMVYAGVKQDYLLGAAGLLLVVLGIFNIATCGTGGCTIVQREERK